MEYDVIYSADGGEMTQVAMAVFIHLVRTRGPFRIERSEMDELQKSMDEFRLELTDGSSEMTVSVEPRED